MIRRGAFSVLELVIAALILSVLVASAFDLLSMQRQEVAGSERSLLMHARAVQRLAEEESRLNVVGFSAPSTAATTTPVFDVALGITETVSIARTEECTGLWKLTVLLSYAEGAAATTRTVEVTRLIVERDFLTRLPAAVRGQP